MIAKLTLLDENTKAGSDVFFPVEITQDDRGFQAHFIDDHRHAYGFGPADTAIQATLREFFNKIFGYSVTSIEYEVVTAIPDDER